MHKKHDYDWNELMNQHIASGMHMKTFCEQHKIPYYAFKYHKYAKKNNKQKEIQFIPVKEEPTTKLTFTINDNEIAVDSSIDDVSLARIVRALSV